MSIPKKIHCLWLSQEIKSEKILRCLDTWRTHLPDYEIIEWNASNFPYNDFLWTKEAFEKKKWAFVTDYFRLWVLYNFGGIYLDMDVYLNSNFDSFLDNELFIGTEFSRQLGPHVIGSIKNHSFIKQCLIYYENKNFSEILIPHIMTKTLEKRYSYHNKVVFYTNKILHLDDITVYPDNYFTINTFDQKNICIHEGLGSWRENHNENPNMNDVLSNYFIIKFFTYDIYKKILFKKILFLILPVFIITLIYKHRQKIKNNRKVQRIVL